MKKLIKEVVVEYSDGQSQRYKSDNGGRVEVECGVSFYRIRLNGDNTSYLINLRSPDLIRSVLTYRDEA